MERYKPYKFEEAIDSIQDFNNFVNKLLKESYDSMVNKISSSIYSNMKSYEDNRLNDTESPYKWAKRNKFNGYQLSILSNIYIQKSPTQPVIKDNNYDKIISKYANKYAKEVQDSYKSRLHSKLFLILKNKELKDVKLLKLKLSVFYDALIEFKFKDGSGFTLNSQITTGTSNKGTFFYRFPSIYQNITLIDGTFIKKQSEDWMLENFAGIDMTLVIQSKHDDKLKKQQDKKLYNQVRKFLGVSNYSNKDEVIYVGNGITIDTSIKKYIQSVHSTNKIIRGQDPNSTWKNLIYIYPENTRLIITYIDNTKLEMNITHIGNADNIKSAFILNDKKLNANLGIEFNYLSGIVTKIINMGKFTKELI